MSEAAAAPSNGTRPSNNRMSGDGKDEVPRMMDDAALDAREAALDAVFDRIDEVIPQARARVQQEKQDPDSRMFSIKQQQRTRTAFIALKRTAVEIRRVSEEELDLDLDLDTGFAEFAD